MKSFLLQLPALLHLTLNPQSVPIYSLKSIVLVPQILILYLKSLSVLNAPLVKTQAPRKGLSLLQIRLLAHAPRQSQENHRQDPFHRFPLIPNPSILTMQAYLPFMSLPRETRSMCSLRGRPQEVQGLELL